MSTEFEVSTRLIFWGDNLDPKHLASDLGLNPSFCSIVNKGDVHRRHSKNVQVSHQKTGRLSYEYCKESPNAKRNPEVQFSFFSDLLAKMPSSLSENYNVDSLELQVSIYYGDVVPGESDFFIPHDLVIELSRHKIRLFITVLP